MNRIHRFLLVACLLCPFCGTVSAQRYTAVVSLPTANPAYVDPPTPSSPFPDDGSWSQGLPFDSDLGNSSNDGGGGSGQGDSGNASDGAGNFVPSTYLDYDDALKLGESELAQQGVPKPIVSDVVSLAEAVRAAKGLAATPADSTVIVLEQDDNGKVIECKGNAATCHPLG